MKIYLLIFFGFYLPAVASQPIESGSKKEPREITFKVRRNFFGDDPCKSKCFKISIISGCNWGDTLTEIESDLGYENGTCVISGPEGKRLMGYGRISKQDVENISLVTEKCTLNAVGVLRKGGYCQCCVPGDKK